MTADGTNRPRGVRTVAIHGGETPDPATGASVPNIVMSTTYVVDEVAGFSAHDLTPDSPFLYTRWGNPTVRQLEAKLAALEEAGGCVAFASGMAATSALFFSLLSAGDHLVISDVSYAGVAELARETLPRFGISVTPVDMSNLDAVAAAMRPETKLVYAETPVNPILRMTDLAGLVAIAHAGGAKVGVDSTFATPIATKPIALGCDYVVHSLTKYLGGHGDALGGAVLGTDEAMRQLNVEAGIHYGGIISPFNAWLIMRGLSTLPLRMKAHAETAQAVAEFLEAHPKVTRVIYPGLRSHPQHELAARQMANFSGMLTFQVADGPALADAMVDGFDVIHYAVSLGHQRSLIFWMPTDGLMETSFRLEGAALDSYRAYAGDGMFRVSVGLEDAADLIADLEQVLDKA